MKNRLLSCIISVCLLISSLALPVYAIGGTIDTETMDPLLILKKLR
jgi:hypothetical protein